MLDEAPRLTPRMVDTMRRAAQMARARGHPYLGTEHVLLALLEDADGIAGGVALRIGVAEPLRQGILEVMDHPGYAGTEP